MLCVLLVCLLWWQHECASWESIPPTHPSAASVPATREPTYHFCAGIVMIARFARSCVALGGPAYGMYLCITRRKQMGWTCSIIRFVYCIWLGSYPLNRWSSYAFRDRCIVMLTRVRVHHHHRRSRELRFFSRVAVEWRIVQQSLL